MKSSLLLQPLQVGSLTFKNRIMFPPMTTGYEERDGSISARSLHFYERVAKGGTAYVVLGDVAPVRTATPTPKLYDDSQIPSFRALADALHRYDCKLGLQIFHPEYDVPEFSRKLTELQGLLRAMAEDQKQGNQDAYAEKLARRITLGKELDHLMIHGEGSFANTASPERLAEIKESMAQCARRAVQAGVDAIEIHGDRILGSLCSEMLNRRKDQYGGSFENRVRYALETVEAIRQAAPGLVLEYKLPVLTVNADGSIRGRGGLMAEEAVEFAKLLEKAGIDLIQPGQANHVANNGDTIPPMGTAPYCWTLKETEMIKAAVSIPVALVGRIITVERGEEALEKGQADVIAYGRSLLTDPDIPVKAAAQEPIRQCLSCNLGCVDALKNRTYLSCILNAENGNEETCFIHAGAGEKQIAVIGGGIAGLEAARVAALRGYKVTVYEASDDIGGQIRLAAVPPRKQEILRSVDYYRQILPALGVEIRLNTTFSPEDGADAVIVAVGAHAKAISFPGSDRENVVSAWDVLAGKKVVSGRCLVIGGGLVAAETTSFLADAGCSVINTRRSDTPFRGVSSTVLPSLMAEFEEHHVQQYLHTRILSATEEGVQAQDIRTEEVFSIACDWIVQAVGSEPNSFRVPEGIPAVYVGDCREDAAGNIADCIRSAYHAANSI